MRNFHCRLTLILLLLAGLLQTGCRENVLINSKVAPSLNTLGVYSTYLPVITHTYYDDTAITSVNIGGIPIYQAVGAITDPFFGTMTGSTFFQVIPLDNTASLYDGQTIDSAVLILPYSGLTYGDTATQSQSYQVFYIQDPMVLDSTYYSYSTKAIGTALSNPTTVDIYHLRDSLRSNPPKLAVNYPAARIKLNLTPDFDSLIIKAQRKLANSTSPFTDFISAFNGICVRASDTTQFAKAIPYFQLDGGTIYSEAGILVYYHPTGATDTPLIQSYYFDRTYCAHFNRVTKSYSSSPVNNLFTSTAANDQTIALQNLPGAAVDVVIPGMNSLPKGVINKAELQLTMIDDGTSNPSYLQWPEALYPTGVGNGRYPKGIINGLTYNLADYYPLTSISPLSILDGTFHHITRNNGKTYSVFTIGIPREVMSSIQAGNDTLHLHINGSQDFYGAFHMVAGGGGYSGTDTNYRPKLFVVYSKLNN